MIAPLLSVFVCMLGAWPGFFHLGFLFADSYVHAEKQEECQSGKQPDH